MADAADALSARSKVQGFLEAACSGDLEALRKFGSALDEEGKGAAVVAAGVRDAKKRTALHLAAREGQTEVCKFLIEQLRLPVDPKDDDGETPFIHAARQGRLETVEYLLGRGADPSVASNMGATVLHHAAGIGHIEIMKLLLGKGVDVESESVSPVLPLFGLLVMDSKTQSRFCLNTMLSRTLKLLMVSRRCCLLLLLVPSHAWRF